MTAFPKRGNKFGARSVREGGRFYASQAERDFHGELVLRESAGDVRNIVVQPTVELVAGIKYRPDYSCEERGLRGAWRLVWFDVKGAMTREFQLKVRLWREFGPGPLKIVKRQGRRARFMTVREVLPKPTSGAASGERRRA